MESKEEWRVIKGFEDYMISDQGVVKSLKFGKERILKIYTDSRGYQAVGVSKDKKKCTERVHNLLAITFLDYTNDGSKKLIVDHIDNNLSNNSLDNLKIISWRESVSKHKKNKTSKYTGVSWNKSSSKWSSYINNNKRTINLGNFNTEIEASEAYKKALIDIDWVQKWKELELSKKIEDSWKNKFKALYK
jgi:hypothetical protein